MRRDRNTLSSEQELCRLLEAENHAEIDSFLRSLPQLEARQIVSALDSSERGKLLRLLPAEHAADLLEEIPESQATEAIESIPPDAAATIIEEMKSDEQADLLQNVEQAEEILAAMEPSEAKEVRELIEYAPDVAGGLMKTEYLAFSAETLLGEAIQQLQVRGSEYSDYEIQYLYAVSKEGKLIGVLPLRELLLRPANLPISAVMIRDPITVHAESPLNDLIRFFEDHKFLGVPVVDNAQTLLGVVLRRSVDAAVVERSDEALLHRQGLLEEEIRSMPVLTRSRRRMAWLLLNIGLNLISASVIAMYQDTLRQVIALAIFLPIISDMCGCSGNQAVAVTLRELTLGLVRPRDLLKVLFQEIKIGILNGIALGIVIGVIAYLWQGNPYLGLVVGGALSISTLIAVVVGASIPLLLKACRVDPALASGPLLTTITDLSGFFFALSFATMVLEHIRG